MVKHILCAVDISQLRGEVKVLKRAAGLTSFYCATLSVISVVPDYQMSVVGSYFKEGTLKKAVGEADRLLHDFVEEHIPEIGSVQHIIEIGTPYEGILDVIDRIGADLVVMGAHKPELIDKIQGPNSARVARYSSVSVYIVRE